MNQVNVKYVQVAIIVLCIIAFYPCFNAGFVNYDDPEYVQNNIYIQNFSWGNVKQIFLGKTTDLYVPLTIFSYLIEYSVFGDKASVFHTVNILLHIINALLLLEILLKLKIKENYIVLFIVTFFSISPLVAESVCWITERKDVLYCLFYFLASLQFLKYEQLRQNKHLYLCFLFFVMSCLSKPMAVSFPALITIYLLFKRKSVKQFMFLLPFYAVSLLCSIVSMQFISNSGAQNINVASYNFIQKGIIILSEIGYYFFKPFFPVKQQLFHLFPDKENVMSNNSILIYLLGALLLLLFISFAIYKKHRNVVFLFFAWLIFLLPVLQVYVNTHSYVSERYFYVSIIFPVTIVLILIEPLVKQKSVYRGALIIIVLCFVGLTIKQSKVWKNTVSLFQHELKQNPENHYALNNLGVYYNDLQNYSVAMPYLKDAVYFAPQNYLYLSNYGLSLSRLGQIDSAMTCFSMALKINPNHVDALSNLGIGYIQINQRQKALPYFEKAYQLNPNNADVVYNLGIYYFNSGNKIQAKPILQKALELGNNKAKRYLSRY